MKFLNPHLIEKQGLTEEEVQVVLNLHERLDALFEKMSQLDPSCSEQLNELTQLAQQVEDIEFAMQKAWKFEQSKDHHTWWYRAPHCRCPKLDNDDAFGTPYHITRQDCPLHGFKYESSN